VPFSSIPTPPTTQRTLVCFTANTEAPINPTLGGGEGSYIVEEDDARREADVDQKVEVGQHEVPADHLRRAAQSLRG
jgi:hypothetical protein